MRDFEKDPFFVEVAELIRIEAEDMMFKSAEGSEPISEESAAVMATNKVVEDLRRMNEAKSLPALEREHWR